MLLNVLKISVYLQGLLILSPETNLNTRYKSGAITLRDTRPVSKATQVFETNRSVWPVSQPIAKVEALVSELRRTLIR